MQTLRPLPQRYQFQQLNGLVPEADFSLSASGVIDYASSSDAFLAGRGSATYTVEGLPFAVDASAYAGTTVTLTAQGAAIAPGTAPVHFLPGMGFQLTIATNPALSATFSLTGSGAIVLDDAYPFVALGYSNGMPLIMLQMQTLRTRRPCLS